MFVNKTRRYIISNKECDYKLTSRGTYANIFHTSSSNYNAIIKGVLGVEKATNE